MLDRLKKKHRVAKKEIQRAASLVRVRRHAQPPTEHPQVGKEWLLHARPGRRGAAVGVDGPRPAAVRLLACSLIGSGYSFMLTEPRPATVRLLAPVTILYSARPRATRSAWELRCTSLRGGAERPLRAAQCETPKKETRRR